MWSGVTVCSQPPSSASPWTCITLEPMPSIAAPILSSMRARSCTCGSEAALRITVVPSISAAAISAFSVPITDGSSMKKSHGLQAAVAAPGCRCRGRARRSRRARGRRRGAGRAGGGRSRRRPAAASAPRRSAPAAGRRPGTRRGSRSASAGVDARSCPRSSPRSATVFSPRRSTLHAEVGEQGEHGLDVPDARDVVQHDLLVGEEAAGEQRQRRVLVAGGHDRAGQRHPAFDDELLHGAAGLRPRGWC